MTATTPGREELRQQIADMISAGVEDGLSPDEVAGNVSLMFDLAAKPADEGWQDISTAPKDGTHILAYRLPIGIRFTNNTNPPTVVHWFDDPDEPGFYTSVNERAPEYPFNPTHWKPLGVPPSTTGEPKR